MASGSMSVVDFVELAWEILKRVKKQVNVIKGNAELVSHIGRQISLNEEKLEYLGSKQDVGTSERRKSRLKNAEDALKRADDVMEAAKNDKTGMAKAIDSVTKFCFAGKVQQRLKEVYDALERSHRGTVLVF